MQSQLVAENISINYQNWRTGIVTRRSGQTARIGFADGSEAAGRRLARVLVNDCASGVMRHADAGYELAMRTAREQGLNLPMLRP